MTSLPTPLRRVCIVMMSAVGDAVHVLPVINALKRHSPGVHITWVLQPGPASLVRGHNAVDEILIFERSKGWRAFAAIRSQLAARTFDLVIDLQVYLKAGVITSFARAPIKLGFDRTRARDLNWLFTTDRVPPHALHHVQDQYFEFLTALGISPEPVVWDLGPWSNELEAQRNRFAQVDRPVATFIIGSSKPQKDWIPERWSDVADALWHDFGLQPLLAGAQSPRELATESIIMDRKRNGWAPLSALGSGLRNLVGILDGSAIVLALDTGPLHMSVALDKPVVSLMGYADPRRTGPYRKFHDLIIDAYHEPDEDSPITMKNRFDRMPRITARDVLDRVERWRTAYQSAVTRPNE